MLSRRKFLHSLGIGAAAGAALATSPFSLEAFEPSRHGQAVDAKTALGAEERVAWEHAWNPVPVLEQLRSRGCQIAAVETSTHAVDLFDWQPAFPVCLVFGHEVEGIRPEVAALCDTHVRIPMLGAKHSLNVATAGGVVVYELLRKYRQLMWGQAL